MKWISVKKRMPSPNAKYCILVYGILETQNTPDVHKCHYYEVHDHNGITNQFWESDSGYDITEVTHWIPLPKPPEE